MDGLGDLLAAFGDGFLSGLTGWLTTNAPALLASGLVAFLGGLGTWLYETVGVLLAGLNVVTQRPEAWTNRLDVVQDGWQGARVLASAFLVCLLAAHVTEWARSDGAPADRLADAVGDLALAAAAVQVSLELVALVMPAYNALLTWAAADTSALPGWAAAGELSAAQAASYEGLARLVLAVEVAWAYVHALIGVAWWDVLLVVMPLAVAAGGWWYTRPWLAKWGTAVAASLVAQVALCLAVRLTGRLVERAAQEFGRVQMPEDVSRAAVYLLLAIGATALVVMLAGQLHSGVSVLHPFSSAGRASRGVVAAGGSAGSAARAVFVGGIALVGGPALGGAANAAQTAGTTATAQAAQPSSPVPVAPPV